MLPDLHVSEDILEQPLEARFQCVDLRETALSASQKKAWEKAAPDYTDWKKAGFLFGRIPFDPVVNIARPLILTSEVCGVEIPIGRKAAGFHFLGQIAMNGYPVRADLGRSVFSTSVRDYRGTCLKSLSEGYSVL